MIPWVTVETLAPGEISVATVDGEKRGFASVQRVLQRLLTKSPALYDSINTQGILEVIGTARARAEGVELDIPTTSGVHKLVARPVLGPTGGVHGVQIWLGPTTSELGSSLDTAELGSGLHIAELGSSLDAAVSAPPAAVGMVWDLATQTLHQPSVMTELSGIAAEEHVPQTSVAELFQRASQFDRHGEVLPLLYAPEVGGKLQFDMTLGHRSAGRPRQWRVTVRARADEQLRGAWWLLEDVTPETATPTWPTLEQVGLREAHRRAGTYLAVVQAAHASIAHWLTDPAPWLRWDYLFRPVDVFHPDDRGRLRDTAERIRSGYSIDLTVRTLDYAGGYTPTRMLLSPCPGYAEHDLVIGQLVLAIDDASASPPVAGPVGYDDQLRRRLRRQAGLSVGGLRTRPAG